MLYFSYVIMFIAKLTVYFYSGVMALLAEAFHSLSSTSNTKSRKRMKYR